MDYNGTTSTSPFEEPWKVFKRLSKEEIKITGKKFEDEPMAEISFTNPDDTKTTQMKIKLTKDMSKHELSEMIFAVGSTLSYIDNVCFIQILKSNLSKFQEQSYNSWLDIFSLVKITSLIYFLKNRLRNRNNPKTHTSERTRAISVQQA